MDKQDSLQCGQEDGGLFGELPRPDTPPVWVPWEPRATETAFAQGRRKAEGDGVYTMLGGGEMSTAVGFGRCALVGSSDKMVGQGVGADIDGHDTVIRVNRIPVPEFAQDFGLRTDVLFTGAVADSVEQYSQAGIKFKFLGGAMGSCAYSGGCPFTALLLKGADARECKMDFEGRYPPSLPGWRPSSSSVSVAHQDEAINRLGYWMLQHKGYLPQYTHRRLIRPTNGFQAFLTAGLLCESVDVYGFSGSTGTADGHEVNLDIHNMTREHELMAWAAKRTLDDNISRYLGLQCHGVCPKRRTTLGQVTIH